jgi:sugar O-acyltransferase (sialic acid O-acetyltransferase NeuD family)
LKNLIIIGARGFGREIFDFAQHCLGYNSEFQIKGFLDDNPQALSDFKNYPPILSSVEEYEVKETDVFICGLGSVKWTEHYVNIILGKGGNFINLIHKNAVVRVNVELGKGVIIGQGSLISTDVKIEDFTQIMSYCILGHDVTVGKYCRLGDYVFLGGFTTVKNHSVIAVRATVLAKLKIEENAIIGAGSVVIKNVKANTSVFGIPAKKIEF